MEAGLERAAALIERACDRLIENGAPSEADDSWGSEGYLWGAGDAFSIVEAIVERELREARRKLAKQQ